MLLLECSLQKSQFASFISIHSLATTASSKFCSSLCKERFVRFGHSGIAQSGNMGRATFETRTGQVLLREGITCHHLPIYLLDLFGSYWIAVIA